MIEVISPAPLMTSLSGAAIGELSKIVGLYHGRIVAAIALPKNVTAMTSDASRVSARKSDE